MIESSAFGVMTINGRSYISDLFIWSADRREFDNPIAKDPNVEHTNYE